MDPHDDPTVEGFRRQITDADLEILQAVNRRIALVAKLHAYKREHGYAMIDPLRESWILDNLTRANAGPISDRRLAQLHGLVLEICKEQAAANERLEAS